MKIHLYVHEKWLQVREGDLVLMDVGCELHSYVSDLTRTWPPCGKFSAAQVFNLYPIQSLCGFSACSCLCVLTSKSFLDSLLWTRKHFIWIDHFYYFHYSLSNDYVSPAPVHTYMHNHFYWLFNLVAFLLDLTFLLYYFPSCWMLSQEELYDLILQTNKECIKLCKPGATILDIHDYSVHFVYLFIVQLFKVHQSINGAFF